MELRGIHHITGITADLPRAHDFLEETLGLRLVKKTLNQDDGRTEHWFWARYDGKEVGERSALTLFGWPPNGVRAQPGYGQTHHIAFRTTSQEEQLEWREHLLAKGIHVSPVMDRVYFKSIYFQAPDGLLLEIATDGPGFTVDEAPHKLGQELRLPAWLEADRKAIEGGLSPLESEALEPPRGQE
jgi:glyoxalase family protein